MITIFLLLAPVRAVFARRVWRRSLGNAWLWPKRVSLAAPVLYGAAFRRNSWFTARITARPSPKPKGMAGRSRMLVSIGRPCVTLSKMKSIAYRVFILAYLRKTPFRSIANARNLSISTLSNCQRQAAKLPQRLFS